MCERGLSSSESDCSYFPRLLLINFFSFSTLLDRNYALFTNSYASCISLSYLTLSYTDWGLELGGSKKSFECCFVGGLGFFWPSNFEINREKSSIDSLGSPMWVCRKDLRHLKIALESIICGFCWLNSPSINVRKSLIFYLVIYPSLS
jgi:hypothetical protein